MAEREEDGMVIVMVVKKNGEVEVELSGPCTVAGMEVLSKVMEEVVRRRTELKG